VNRLTNSIAVLLTISYGGWLAVCGRLTVGFIYSAFTFSFQLAMGFSSLVTMTGARGSRLERQDGFLQMSQPKDGHHVHPRQHSVPDPLYCQSAFTTTRECAVKEQVSGATECSTLSGAGDVAKMRGAGFRIMNLLESDAARREAAEEQASGTLPRVRSGRRG